ncbi:MAG: bifunctional serine/threonine-protein kinase/formylglycine-generating enzyme family protein [Chloroflexota bacterium]
MLHNRYRIVKLLGQGGFGAVYRAWDTNLNGPCAVKENFDTSPAAQAQFAREASLLFNLRHPNLPRVFDSFTVTGQGQYLVMDYIEGEDLAHLLERTGAPLDEEQALAWIGQVCTALSYLHAQNPAVIHRDLKPANIRITPQGQAMLVDFGIAKVYDPTLKTTVGARAVTPGYSPPEQYGLGKTDAQSDVYALGATLYTLLTCREPPASVDIVSGSALPPEAAQKVNPTVSVGVSAALEKAMRLNRAERYGSVAEFLDALKAGQPPQRRRRIHRGGTQVVGYAGPASLARQTQNIPWKWVLLGLMVVALGVALFSILPGRIGGEESLATQMALEATMTARRRETKLPVMTETPPPATWAEPTQTLSPTSAIPDSMALIPAGEFQMGSESGDSDERPVHAVYLDAYYIDHYEVTNARYAECVEVGECDPPTSRASNTRSSYYGSPEYADYPVIYVSWEMADAYCQWREARLPTEAEWEKAARGGLEGKQYPWGDDFDGSLANFCDKNCSLGWADKNYDDGYEDTAPAGSYAPNGYGLYDMAGNVWEWVQDWYSSTFYSNMVYDNPVGPDSSQYRVLRGGSWSFNVSDLRSTRRYLGKADSGFDSRGFRCARPADLSKAPMRTGEPADVEATVSASLPTSTPTPTPTPTPTSAAPEGMALIPTGEFQMGSESGESNERPVHTVFLDAYFIDKYEVTNARYAECVKARVCDPPVDSQSYLRKRYYGNPEFNDYPVTEVNWGMAKTFCEWRGGRLPTEAEWEKAARGRLEGKLYPWGDEAPVCQMGIPNGAKFDDDASCNDTDTEAVGSYAPNGYGLYDMAGNVWEWVQDWYSSAFFGSSPAYNPFGPDTGQYRVLRGGSWSAKLDRLRVATRNYYDPGARDDFIGFRCLMAPEE